MTKTTIYFFCLIAFAFLMLAIVGCNDDSTTDQTEITLGIDPSSLSFEASGDTAKTVTVTTNSESWDRQPSHDWINVEVSGNLMSVSVEDNTSDDGRTGSITVTAGDKTERVTVSQNGTSGVSNTLTVTPESLIFEADDTTGQQITVETDATIWSHEVSESWVSTAPDGNNITVSVTANELEEPRSAVLTVTAGDQLKDVLIEQKGKNGQNPNAIKVVFTSASGIYYGLSGNRTGKFSVTLTGADNAELNIVAFSDIFADPASFIPADADYTCAASQALDTYIAGSGNSSETLDGTFYIDTVNKVPISDGSIAISYDRATKEYTVEAVLSGTNLETTSEAVTESMKFSYKGAIAFENRAGTLTYLDYGTNEYFEAYYYGDYSTGNGIGQYYINLCEELDYEYYTYHGFIIDRLFGELSSDSSNASLPSGVYRVRDTGALYTLSPGDDTTSPKGSYNYFYDLMGVGLDNWDKAKYGTIVIDNKGNNQYDIKGYIFGKNNETGEMKDIAFGCSGEIKFENRTPETKYDVTLSNCESLYYGDFYENEGGNYVLYINDREKGYQLMLEICTPSYVSYLLPEGTYNPGSDYSPFTFLKGYYYGDNAYGSAFGVGDVDNNKYDPIYLITGGSFDIRQGEMSVYNISGEVFGNDGVNANVPIKFSYSGLPTFINKSGEDEDIWFGAGAKSMSKI